MNNKVYKRRIQTIKRLQSRRKPPSSQHKKLPVEKDFWSDAKPIKDNWKRPKKFKVKSRIPKFLRKQLKRWGLRGPERYWAPAEDEGPLNFQERMHNTLQKFRHNKKLHKKIKFHVKWTLSFLIKKIFIILSCLLTSVWFIVYLYSTFIKKTNATVISMSSVKRIEQGHSLVEYATTAVEPIFLGNAIEYTYLDSYGNLTKHIHIRFSDSYYVIEEQPYAVCGDPVITTYSSCACFDAITGILTPFPEPYVPASCTKSFKIRAMGEGKGCILQPAIYTTESCIYNQPMYIISTITGVSKYTYVSLSNDSIINSTFVSKWDLKSIKMIDMDGLTLTLVASLNSADLQFLVGSSLIRDPVTREIKLSKEKIFLGNPGLCASSTSNTGIAYIDTYYYGNHSNAHMAGVAWCDANVIVTVPSVKSIFDSYYPLSYYLPSNMVPLHTPLTDIYSSKTTNDYSPCMCFSAAPSPVVCLPHHVTIKGGQLALDLKSYYPLPTADIFYPMITSTSVVTAHWEYNGIYVGGVLLNSFDFYNCRGQMDTLHIYNGIVYSTPKNYTEALMFPMNGEDKVIIKIQGTKDLYYVEDDCKFDHFTIKNYLKQYSITIDGTCLTYTMTTDKSFFHGSTLYSGVETKFTKPEEVGTINVTFTICTPKTCKEQWFVFVTGGVDINKYAYDVVMHVLDLVGIQQKALDNLQGHWYSFILNMMYGALMHIALFIASSFLLFLVTYICSIIFYTIIRKTWLKNVHGDIYIFIIFFTLDILFLYFISGLIYVMLVRCFRIKFRAQSKRRR